MAPPNDDAFMQLAQMINGLEQALQLHRGTVNRAIGLLNNEVYGFRSELDRDKADRAARQAQVDAKLQSIEDGQRLIRTWQWIRIGVEAAAILIVLAYWFGSR